jgi:hypothetical protein
MVQQLLWLDLCSCDGACWVIVAWLLLSMAFVWRVCWRSSWWWCYMQLFGCHALVKHVSWPAACGVPGPHPHWPPAV